MNTVRRRVPRGRSLPETDSDASDTEDALPGAAPEDATASGAQAAALADVRKTTMHETFVPPPPKKATARAAPTVTLGAAAEPAESSSEYDSESEGSESDTSSSDAPAPMLKPLFVPKCVHATDVSTHPTGASAARLRRRLRRGKRRKLRSAPLRRRRHASRRATSSWRSA